jgi:formyltetrahydrofolate synthetase
VATVRALKMHGGVGQIVAGKPLDAALIEENPEAVRRGCANLAQHIAIVGAHGVPAVVAINRFADDRDSELEVVREEALKAGAHDAVVSEHVTRGGAGAEDLARAVWAAAADHAPNFRFLYPDEASLEQRIETIATRIYGADGVDFSEAATAHIAELERRGAGRLPVCMAKTPLSLSHDPALKGRPTGFRLPVRDVRLYAGAGFVTAYCGDMLMMPGLPSHPSGEKVDINADGEAVGLF